MKEELHAMTECKELVTAENDVRFWGERSDSNCNAWDRCVASLDAACRALRNTQRLLRAAERSGARRMTQPGSAARQLHLATQPIEERLSTLRWFFPIARDSLATLEWLALATHDASSADFGQHGALMTRSAWRRRVSLITHAALASSGFVCDRALALERTVLALIPSSARGDESDLETVALERANELHLSALVNSAIGAELSAALAEWMAQRRVSRQN